MERWSVSRTLFNWTLRNSGTLLESWLTFHLYVIVAIVRMGLHGSLDDGTLDGRMKSPRRLNLQLSSLCGSSNSTKESPCSSRWNDGVSVADLIYYFHLSSSSRRWNSMERWSFSSRLAADVRSCLPLSLHIEHR